MPGIGKRSLFTALLVGCVVALASPGVVDASCSPQQIAPCADLIAVKDVAGGITLTWSHPGSDGREYHVNAVRDKTFLASNDPKLPPVGLGSLECTAPFPSPSPSCTDLDALSPPPTGDPRPLLFYRALGSCGGTDGRLEGAP